MSVSFDAVICHRGLAWWYYECTWYMSCNQYGIVCSCFANGLACLKRKTPFTLCYHVWSNVCIQYTLIYSICHKTVPVLIACYNAIPPTFNSNNMCSIRRFYHFYFRLPWFGLQRCWFVFTTRPSLYLFYIWFHNLDSFRFVECLLILNDVEVNKPICYFKCKYFTV